MESKTSSPQFSPTLLKKVLWRHSCVKDQNIADLIQLCKHIMDDVAPKESQSELYSMGIRGVRVLVSTTVQGAYNPTTGVPFITTLFGDGSSLGSQGLQGLPLEALVYFWFLLADRVTFAKIPDTDLLAVSLMGYEDLAEVMKETKHGRVDREDAYADPSLLEDRLKMLFLGMM
jgi:hypothetical protein